MDVLETNMIAVGEMPPSIEIRAEDPTGSDAEKAIAENTLVAELNLRLTPEELEDIKNWMPSDEDARKFWEFVGIPPRVYEGYSPEHLSELEEWI